jgi:hypothetical protein
MPSLIQYILLIINSRSYDPILYDLLSTIGKTFLMFYISINFFFFSFSSKLFRQTFIQLIWNRNRQNHLQISRPKLSSQQIPLSLLNNQNILANNSSTTATQFNKT